MNELAFRGVIDALAQISIREPCGLAVGLDPHGPQQGRRKHADRRDRFLDTFIYGRLEDVMRLLPPRDLPECDRVVVVERDELVAGGRSHRKRPFERRNRRLIRVFRDRGRSERGERLELRVRVTDRCRERRDTIVICRPQRVRGATCCQHAAPLHERSGQRLLRRVGDECVPKAQRRSIQYDDVPAVHDKAVEHRLVLDQAAEDRGSTGSPSNEHIWTNDRCSGVRFRIVSRTTACRSSQRLPASIRRRLRTVW